MDVHGTIDKEDISLISENPIVVNEVPDFGYNPFDYLDEEDY